MNAKREILNFTRDELAEDLSRSLDLQPFRARQLISWLYRKRLSSFEAMTDIARPTREQLGEHYSIFRPKLVDLLYSADGSQKYLFELSDGECIESVLVKQPARNTLCISSQVGCAMGCTFCRTATMGLKRHLETSEIVSQILAVQDILDKQAVEQRLSAPVHIENIVFMGMGEPLHNFDNVLRTVRLLNDDLGLNFSSRKITLSTSGLVPAIKKLGKTKPPAILAVSLNATTDETRNALIPINKRYPLSTLLQTLREYPLNPRQRITIEYVLIGGLNDTEGDLKRLPGLLHGIRSKINLIAYNETSGLGFRAPRDDVVRRWHTQLLNKGICATIRLSRGADISAACGQLATKHS